MKIKERLEFANKPAVVTLRGEENVTAAITSMAQNNIGSVVIVDADMKVQGIVTERDLVRRLLGEKRDPDTTKLSDLMTSDPRTANEDDDVVEQLRLMSNERFRHLPIVDESGRLISILSQGDFVAYTWPELLVLVLDGEGSQTPKTPRKKVSQRLAKFRARDRCPQGRDPAPGIRGSARKSPTGTPGALKRKQPLCPLKEKG